MRRRAWLEIVFACILALWMALRSPGRLDVEFAEPQEANAPNIEVIFEDVNDLIWKVNSQQSMSEQISRMVKE